MNKSYPEFISKLEGTDPKMFHQVSSIFDLAMTPGELDAKTKILISLALDALAGEEEGVRTLSKVARNMGISDAQISEALRIAYLVAGNKVLGASRAAFEK